MLNRSGKVWSAELSVNKCRYHGKSRTLHFEPEAQLILTKYLTIQTSEGSLKPSTFERAVSCRLAFRRQWAMNDSLAVSVPHHIGDVSQEFQSMRRRQLVAVRGKIMVKSNGGPWQCHVQLWRRSLFAVVNRSPDLHAEATLPGCLCVRLECQLLFGLSGRLDFVPSRSSRSEDRLRKGKLRHSSMEY